MPFCEICNEWTMNPVNHQCPPVYEVWDEDYLGNDYKTIMAKTPEEAGEKYATWLDSRGDYQIVNGSEETVKIRKLGEEYWKTYVLSGEPVPQYTCREKS